MLTSKDRAFLKRIASSQSCVYQIGKDGLTEQSLAGILEALTSRELIKINVLQNCDENLKLLAENLSNNLKCETVAVIGRKIILYKLNPKNSKHVLNLN